LKSGEPLLAAPPLKNRCLRCIVHAAISGARSPGPQRARSNL
jgi:hypothetical protein